MSKLTLEYQLPRDQHEVDCVWNAHNIWGALYEMLTDLRSDYKHSENQKTYTSEEVRGLIYRYLGDHGVDTVALELP